MEEPHLGFVDKLASYVAWAFAGAIFFTVGWIALEPVDPLGPVSLLTGHGAIGMLVQASLLAVVAASIGTVIIGRKLPEAGTFAAALGLAIVSLRGGTMQFLLLRTADDPHATVRGLALGLVFESLGWAFVIAVAIAASAIVSRWFRKPDELPLPPEFDDGQLALAGWDVPLLGALLGRPRSCAGTSPADGARHVAIAAVVMLTAQRVFGTGLHDRVITHGQACFVVAASACAGTYVAFRFAPVRSALWPVLAALIAPVLGYLLAAAMSGSSAGASSLPPNIPASHFMRALPIQGVAVGCAAAVATFWWPSVVESAARLAAGRPHVQASLRGRST